MSKRGFLEQASKAYEAPSALGSRLFTQRAPSPKGSKAQRVERKMGATKSRGGATKASRQRSPPHSFAPRLVENARVAINDDCSRGSDDSAPPQRLLVSVVEALSRRCL